MNKMKAAFIGFTPFDGDFYGALEEYAKIGYKGFESGAMLLRSGDPAENLKRVKDFGIAPLTVGLGRGALSTDIVPEVVKNARAIEVNRATVMLGCVAFYRFGQNPNAPTYDDVMAEIENLNAIAKELKKEDIIVTFHNHDCEFLTFYKGKSAYDHMVENSEYLKFEVDCGWATYGHNDPIKVMDKLGDKLAAVHIKDFTYGNAPHPARPGVVEDENLAQIVMPRFTAPGTGNLNLRGCLEKAASMGIEYAIVEQDFMYHMTPAETLTCAYHNMKETGFVE